MAVKKSWESTGAEASMELCNGSVDMWEDDIELYDMQGDGKELWGDTGDVAGKKQWDGI